MLPTKRAVRGTEADIDIRVMLRGLSVADGVVAVDSNRCISAPPFVKDIKANKNVEVILSGLSVAVGVVAVGGNRCISAPPFIEDEYVELSLVPMKGVNSGHTAIGVIGEAGGLCSSASQHTNDISSHVSLQAYLPSFLPPMKSREVGIGVMLCGFGDAIISILQEGVPATEDVNSDHLSKGIAVDGVAVDAVLCPPN